VNFSTGIRRIFKKPVIASGGKLRYTVCRMSADPNSQTEVQYDKTG
jgi:hypothetical protein